GGGPLTQDLADLPAWGDLVPGAGLERIGGHLGQGQSFLDLVEHAQELSHRRQPVTRGELRGRANQRVQLRHDVVTDRGRGETVVFLDDLTQLRAVLGRWASGEDQVGERTQPEQILERGPTGVV